MSQLPVFVFFAESIVFIDIDRHSSVFSSLWRFRKDDVASYVNARSTFTGQVTVSEFDGTVDDDDRRITHVILLC
jgi:hypothetical protein